MLFYRFLFLLFTESSNKKPHTEYISIRSIFPFFHFFNVNMCIAASNFFFNQTWIFICALVDSIVCWTTGNNIDISISLFVKWHFHWNIIVMLIWNKRISYAYISIFHIYLHTTKYIWYLQMTKIIHFGWIRFNWKYFLS